MATRSVLKRLAIPFPSLRRKPAGDDAAVRFRAPKALFLVPLLGAVVIGGCAPETSYWTEVQAPRANQVSYVRLTHEVAFAPGSAQLSEPEAGRLTAFLQRQAVGYGDEVAILRADAPSEPTVTRMQQQTVAAALADLGFDVRHAPAAEGQEAAPGRVVVLVSRYVVTPPACGYWNEDPATDYGNQPSSNFGCATERNLGLMVANPADLLRGREPGPADGDFAAIGIQRYRVDKTEPLQNVGTGTGHGG